MDDAAAPGKDITFYHISPFQFYSQEYSDFFPTASYIERAMDSGGMSSAQVLKAEGDMDYREVLLILVDDIASVEFFAGHTLQYDKNGMTNILK